MNSNEKRPFPWLRHAWFVLLALGIGWMLRDSLSRRNSDPAPKPAAAVREPSREAIDSEGERASILEAEPPRQEASAATPGLARVNRILELTSLPGALKGQVLLTFQSRSDLTEFLRLSQGLNLSVTGPWKDGLALRVGFESPEGLQHAIDEMGDNAPQLGANFLVSPPLPSPPAPAGGDGTIPFENAVLSSIGIDTATDRSNWGEGITVAVIDTGIADHPVFRAGQVSHVDLVNDGGSLNGHGTAIASLIGGQQGRFSGVSPGASLLDVRIAGSDGFGDSYLLAQGIQEAMDRGAKVINISMGSYGDSELVSSTVSEAVRRGITVVAAVGNDGSDVKAWPAAYPGVISVSGVDATGALAYFSNGGNPTLAAPAVGVPAAFVLNGEPVYGIGNGTSQAAALVSGSAAVMLNRGLTPKIALPQQAKPFPGRRMEVGAGMLHLPPTK
ncbi:MAG: S8 family serine peptidase [Verrucomicrobiae bacterium]|nr:S8 family serine peptidase [Verrucomicrobiae bacterium]